MSTTSELTTDEFLDDTDRELLNALQWDFPVDPTPYATLADRLGVSEADVFTRIARVKDAGILRQLSAIFDTRTLGYASSLVAAKVDPDHIDAAAAVISEHPGVSHNYKRNHDYNLWYTLAVPPGQSIDDHLDVLHRDSGSLVTRKLPTLQLYKIGVKLDMTGKTAADARRTVLEHERPDRSVEMVVPEYTQQEIDTIRVVQEDLPLESRPFRGAGRADRDLRRRTARAACHLQGTQVDAPVRSRDEPPQCRVQGQRDGRLGRPRRRAG